MLALVVVSAMSSLECAHALQVTKQVTGTQVRGNAVTAAHQRVALRHAPGPGWPAPGMASAVAPRRFNACALRDTRAEIVPFARAPRPPPGSTRRPR